MAEHNCENKSFFPTSGSSELVELYASPWELFLVNVIGGARNSKIVKKLIHFVCVKACIDPSLVDWPVPEHQSLLQSLGGSVLWNGINTGAHVRAIWIDWWYNNLSTLSLPLLEKVVVGLEARGTRLENIVGVLVHYAKKSLPGLHKRHSGCDACTHGPLVLAIATPIEDDQWIMLETIEARLLSMKGVVSTCFLFGLLHITMILNANARCKSNLERRIGMSLEQTTLDENIRCIWTQHEN